jgi:hypothetical protein
VSRSIRARAVVLVALGAVLTLCGPGCGGRARGFEQFIPEPGPARSALTAVLAAWAEGRPPEAPAATRPEVYVVDKQRRPGQRLARFEVLGEVAAEKARGFAVRLNFEDPDGQDVVRFLVVGTDPVWVFRQEDYEMISHWMHPMKPGEGEGEARP